MTTQLLLLLHDTSLSRVLLAVSCAGSVVSGCWMVLFTAELHATTLPGYCTVTEAYEPELVLQVAIAS